MFNYFVFDGEGPCGLLNMRDKLTGEYKADKTICGSAEKYQDIHSSKI